MIKLYKLTKLYDFITVSLRLQFCKEIRSIINLTARKIVLEPFSLSTFFGFSDI